MKQKELGKDEKNINTNNKLNLLSEFILNVKNALTVEALCTNSYLSNGFFRRKKYLSASHAAIFSNASK